MKLNIQRLFVTPNKSHFIDSYIQTAHTSQPLAYECHIQSVYHAGNRGLWGNFCPGRQSIDPSEPKQSKHNSTAGRPISSLTNKAKRKLVSCHKY